MTELERAKARVEALNRELEQRVAERTTELEESNSKLRELAFYDELTGIGNRRFFEVQADIALYQAKRNGRDRIEVYK